MIQLFDTHQHLIHRSRIGYAWTQNVPSLASGDFTEEDYIAAIGSECKIATLFMETGVDDADYQRETRFAHTLMQQKGSPIAGMIASIRPETDQGFDAWLEESGNLGVVGYRRILHVVADEVSQQATFRSNVRKIGAIGKPFDICFRARQLPFALELAQECDNTRLILDHCGIPDIASGAIESWRNDIAAIAKLPHVNCKLSGIMAYCGDKGATFETIEPYVEHVIESFGPSRIVWGSDWPVVNMGSTVADWIAVTQRILAGLSQSEARHIAYQTAEKIYKVDLGW